MFSTREEAFAHLKSIVVECDEERRKAKSRPNNEVRMRRMEIGLVLLFAEMIARSKPALAQEAETNVASTASPVQPKPPVPTPTRDFVGELQRMAGKPERRSTPVNPL